ncbi:class E sortase [Nocardioides sp. ChNu-153]|uniref:class E sortase n=1 Tax=unclassified Nocardioides TaxID=2615069 RepID=UPI0024067CC9|nr:MULTISPECIES: class E sortase [unclassified Nocardioides]MDF9714658.1 class E sortase [Nocardioides sp. ChNu-99]MDN7119807.1 class E sortase [Nocardioides sp. ChNu-153]
MSPSSPVPGRVPGRAPGRRWSTRVGLLLVALGLGVLAHLAWQLWGTNVVAERRHDEAVTALERAWDDGRDSARVDAGEVTAVVRVPRFGEEYAVPVLEGTSDTALASGLGHFAGSAAPGEVGNVALAGHRVTHGEPLRRMAELQVGDLVVVETRAATHTYRLTTGGDDLEVSFTDTWVVDPRPVDPSGDGPRPVAAPGARLLTLTTCAELFHTDRRLVAFAELVETVER